MPFSLGIPMGVLMVVVGVILLLTMKNKLVGGAVLGLGVVLTMGTLLVMVLAVNSM